LQWRDVWGMFTVPHYNMIKYAREQFFINANDMLDKNGKSNPKAYWKLVKKLMGNCKHSPNIPPLQILDSGEYVINNEDKANILNNLFCSITEIENNTFKNFPNTTK
jgi:hypothetical protein